MSFWILGKLEQRKHCHTRFFSIRTKALKKTSLLLSASPLIWIKGMDGENHSKDTTQWKQVCDFKGWNNSIVKQQGITRIPANILIGPDKRVITQDIRGKELIDKVRQLTEQDKEKEKPPKRQNVLERDKIKIKNAGKSLWSSRSRYRRYHCNY